MEGEGERRRVGGGEKGGGGREGRRGERMEAERRGSEEGERTELV